MKTGGLKFEARLGEKYKTLSTKQTKIKGFGDMTQVVGKLKALSSIPSTAKTKTKTHTMTKPAVIFCSARPIIQSLRWSKL
jgi:hypothetical protein